MTDRTDVAEHQVVTVSPLDRDLGNGIRVRLVDGRAEIEVPSTTLTLDLVAVDALYAALRPVRNALRTPPQPIALPEAGLAVYQLAMERATRITELADVYVLAASPEQAKAIVQEMDTDSLSEVHWGDLFSDYEVDEQYVAGDPEPVRVLPPDAFVVTEAMITADRAKRARYENPDANTEDEEDAE